MADRLKEVPWLEKTGLTNQMPLRTIKMVAARCDLCLKDIGWAENCPHKPGPYHGMQAIEDPRGKMVFDEETDTWREDKQKAQIIVDYKLAPNIIQVPLMIRVGSGLEVERALVIGHKFLQDVKPLLADGSPDPAFDGYASMCEFQNCYKSNPKIRTRHTMLAKETRVPAARQVAHYCSENHARRARLKDSTESSYVPIASEESAESAREQLARIAL